MAATDVEEFEGRTPNSTDHRSKADVFSPSPTVAAAPTALVVKDQGSHLGTSGALVACYPAQRFSHSPQENHFRTCALDDGPAVLLEILSYPHIHCDSYPLLFHPICKGPMQALPYPGLVAEAPRPPMFPVVREASVLWLHLSSCSGFHFPAWETRLSIGTSPVPSHWGRGTLPLTYLSWLRTRVPGQ